MAAGRIDAWQSLLWQALEILDDAFAAHATAASWSLGGGTVLMLRYQHRLSKDIDIFVPDPQMLAEEANFLKLYLPEGESGIAPSISPPATSWTLLPSQSEIAGRFRCSSR